MMVKVGLSGAAGKMGRRIITLSKGFKNLKIIFGLESRSHPEIGKTIERVKITADTQKIEECDCLIDFSTACVTPEYLNWAVKFDKCMVIGTTGLDDATRQKIKAAARHIAIVFSPNMSVGVNLLFRLLKVAAGTLKNYAASIQETHHIHKKDAPSGTAKRMAEILIEQGFNIKPEDIKSDRYDEIVGDHKVLFESEVDRIELSHSAKTRDIFVEGALKAAQWVVGKEPGLYSMDDVLFC